jgi:chromate transporter
MKQTWPVIRLFAWLGAVAFGGPLAHIALMQRELVERRGWLSRQEFLDLAGAMSLIPGPNSSELAMALGARRAGTPGLWGAGVAFIAPAFFIVLALAALYSRFGQAPMPRAILYGVQPVVVAIIVHAGSKLVPTGCKVLWTRALAILAFGLAALHLVPELAILFGAGALGLGIGWSENRKRPQVLAPGREQVLGGSSGPESGRAMLLLGAGQVLAGAKTWGVFLSFLKIGSILYGSGYVLLAFLRDEFVPRYLSDAQLLDAISIGQVTPGPVFTAATFIGYLIDGVPGAIAATAGIFLPSFLLVFWLLRALEKVRDSIITRRFLDAVNAASLALMGAVLIELGHAALVDEWTLAIFATSLAALWKTNWNSAWLIGAGALAGLASGAWKLGAVGMLGL